MEETGRALFGESFAVQGLDFSGKIDPQIYGELAELNKHLAITEHHDRFRDDYIDRLALALSQIAEDFVLPGVRVILEELLVRQQMMGLLTGNYSRAAPLKIAAASMDMNWFKINAFGDEGRSRNELPLVAMRKYETVTGREISGKDVMIVGDTPRDIECAKVNGCYAFAVATGRWSYEELKSAGADTVVSDLSDPEPLFSLLG